MTNSRMHSLQRVAGLLALALCCLHPAPAKAQGSSGGLIEAGPAPNLFLIYTGDVIGYLDACG